MAEDMQGGGEVKIFPPDYTLKKRIGDVTMSEILSPEIVAQAQVKIDSKKDDFLNWVSEDIALLETGYAQASAKLNDNAAELLELDKVTNRIRSQAGTFGYDLATLIAKSLSGFCSKHPTINAEQLVVIRKHIDALGTVFKHKITGDGGNVGKELLEMLLKLVDKYS